MHFLSTPNFWAISRFVLPSRFNSKISFPYTSIFTYFLGIAKPPRVVLLSYTRRPFVYCLLFTDLFTPERRAWDFLLWALRAGAFVLLQLWSKDRCTPEPGAGLGIKAQRRRWRPRCLQRWLAEGKQVHHSSILQDLIFGVRSLELMPSSRCRMKWFSVCLGVSARFLHGFCTVSKRAEGAFRCKIRQRVQKLLGEKSRWFD